MALFSELRQPYLVAAPLAAGSSSTNISSADLDLQTLGYDSCIFMCANSTTVVGTGCSMNLQVGATTAAFAAACTPGTTAAITAASTVGAELIYIDAQRIQHRYVRVTYNASTGHAFSGVWAIPYDSRSRLVTSSSDLTQAGSVTQPTTTA